VAFRCASRGGAARSVVRIAAASPASSLQRQPAGEAHPCGVAAVAAAAALRTDVAPGRRWASDRVPLPWLGALPKSRGEPAGPTGRPPALGPVRDAELPWRPAGAAGYSCLRVGPRRPGPDGRVCLASRSSRGGQADPLALPVAGGRWPAAAPRPRWAGARKGTELAAMA